LLVKKIFTFYLQEKAGEWEESRLDWYAIVYQPNKPISCHLVSKTNKIWYQLLISAINITCSFLCTSKYHIK
jgi:hypothetical protein